MKIDKNIPLTPSGDGAAATARKLEINDSVFFNNAGKANNFYQACKRVRKDCEFTRKAVKGGFRVWRIK